MGDKERIDKAEKDNEGLRQLVEQLQDRVEALEAQQGTEVPEQPPASP